MFGKCASATPQHMVSKRGYAGRLLNNLLPLDVEDDDLRLELG
jgi:hypothetical protein